MDRRRPGHYALVRFLKILAVLLIIVLFLSLSSSVINGNRRVRYIHDGTLYITTGTYGESVEEIAPTPFTEMGYYPEDNLHIYPTN